MARSADVEWHFRVQTAVLYPVRKVCPACGSRWLTLHLMECRRTGLALEARELRELRNEFAGLRTRGRIGGAPRGGAADIGAFAGRRSAGGVPPDLGSQLHQVGEDVGLAAELVGNHRRLAGDG